MASNLQEYLNMHSHKFDMTTFAKNAGVGRSYLSLVIHGKKMPSAKFCKRIEAATGGKLKWLELIEYSDRLMESRKA